MEKVEMYERKRGDGYEYCMIEVDRDNIRSMSCNGCCNAIIGVTNGKPPSFSLQLSEGFDWRRSTLIS
ncbi:MAG: hypothetical protein IPI15_19245 [Saprospiraceae bacterium]|uniref:hypothetical protein n=1 Tax=Candidatus Brachybacter algidus TaxID=2982024 RepID=UPI00257DA95D|nr:hypothetical protein [Candidatus Brachybacter algidus]MBK7605656.1 hypothetical protein [Candidatus Brachybacter algidus]